MGESRWERYAPLTGVVFVAIVIIVFAVGGETPDEHDSAATVQNFYIKHHDKHSALSFVIILGIPFLLFFASTLRRALRRAGGTGQLANASLAAAAVAAAGFGLIGTIHLALSNAGESIKTLATTQTLNVLDNNDFLPAAAGMAVFVFAAGLSAVRHGGLPSWLGWVGVVIGVATFTPAGFIAFLAAGVWVIIASLLLTFGPSASSGAAPERPPTPAAA